MGDEEKDELLKNIRLAKEIGQKYIVTGRELQKEGQRLKDEANAAEALLLFPFEGIDYSGQREMWGGTVASGEYNLARFNFRIPLVSTSGSPIVQLFNSAPDLFVEAQNFNPETKEGANIAVANLCHQVESVNTKDETIRLLIKYGLDKGYGNERSPVDSFEIGFAAFENPVTDGNPAVTSLIPVRSCIDSMISILLRRRINQEPASGEIKKIQSIGNQLKYDTILDVAVDTWAEEYHELSNLLSNAKMQNMDRNEWRKTLQRAMNFIIGFLNILDPEKLKRSRED